MIYTIDVLMTIAIMFIVALVVQYFLVIKPAKNLLNKALDRKQKKGEQ